MMTAAKYLKEKLKCGLGGWFRPRRWSGREKALCERRSERPPRETQGHEEPGQHDRPAQLTRHAVEARVAEGADARYRARNEGDDDRERHICAEEGDASVVGARTRCVCAADQWAGEDQRQGQDSGHEVRIAEHLREKGRGPDQTNDGAGDVRESGRSHEAFGRPPWRQPRSEPTEDQTDRDPEHEATDEEHERQWCELERVDRAVDRRPAIERHPENAIDQERGMHREAEQSDTDELPPRGEAERRDDHCRRDEDHERFAARIEADVGEAQETADDRDRDIGQHARADRVEKGHLRAVVKISASSLIVFSDRPWRNASATQVSRCCSSTNASTRSSAFSMAIVCFSTSTQYLSSSTMRSTALR